MSKTRIRAPKITIDSPSTGSTPWVSMVTQKVIENDEGKVIQVIDRYGQVYRNIPMIAGQMFTAYDPITNQPLQVSMLGVGALITAVAATFLAEDYSGTVDQNLTVWIDK